MQMELCFLESAVLLQGVIMVGRGTSDPLSDLWVQGSRRRCWSQGAPSASGLPLGEPHAYLGSSPSSLLRRRQDWTGWKDVHENTGQQGTASFQSVCAHECACAHECVCPRAGTCRGHRTSSCAFPQVLSVSFISFFFWRQSLTGLELSKAG